MADEIRVTPKDETQVIPPEPPAAPAPPAAARVETAHATAGAEPSLGELFRELATESSTLIKQEIGLAKVEMRENVRSLTKDLVLLAAGGGLLLVGLLTLTAFLVAALGDMLGDEYWLGALIVGAVYALIGGLLLLKGKNGMQHDDLKPDQTIQSLQADKRWAQAEARQVKRDLTT